MTEQESIQLKLTALAALNQCGDYLLPFDSFFHQVKMSLGHGVTLTDFREIVNKLENLGLAIGIKPAIGGDPKWKITDNGKAVLAECNY